MPELSVAIFATDNDQRAVLQVLVDGTSVARTVCSNGVLPLAANDSVIRKTQAYAPDVILVDVAPDGRVELCALWNCFIRKSPVLPCLRSAP